MKMKTIIGLLAIAVMLLAAVVGCKAAPEDEVYRDVSIWRMTVSIPGEWERTEESGEMVEEITSAWEPELRQTAQIDAYQPPKSKDVLLMLVTMDMKRMYEESEGIPWEGWESALEAEGMTKEDIGIMWSSALLSGLMGEKVEELTKTAHRQLAIHGNEAWESQFTGKIEGELGRVIWLIIFGEDDAGILIMLVKEAEWDKFEGTWGKIRDSVELTPQA